MLKEFKKFALKGNMIDLAIGIIIGGAFSGIVNSLVNDIVMPVLSILTNKVDFTNLFIALDGKKYATLEAAKGVDFFEPLNPSLPADLLTKTLPTVSVRVTIVLLYELKI